MSGGGKKTVVLGFSVLSDGAFGVYKSSVFYPSKIQLSTETDPVDGTIMCHSIHCDIHSVKTLEQEAREVQALLAEVPEKKRIAIMERYFYQYKDAVKEAPTLAFISYAPYYTLHDHASTAVSWHELFTIAQELADTLVFIL